MAMTPHKVYFANQSSGGGVTPDSISMVDGFTGRTASGPCTITRIVFDFQMFEGTNSTGNWYDPAHLFNVWSYIVALEQVPTGTGPGGGPVLSPLFSSANDIMHVGLMKLRLLSATNLATMNPERSPIVIETQRKIPAGSDAVLWFAFNNLEEDDAVAGFTVLSGVIIYLT